MFKVYSGAFLLAREEKVLQSIQHAFLRKENIV